MTPPARLQLFQVSKSFPARPRPLAVLEDVSIAVQSGELVALIGPSGCGKSTLLDLAAGLELPTGGEVLVEGRPAAGSTGHAGYMPQKDLLLPWLRLLDNLTLGLEVRGLPRRQARQRVVPMIGRFGLSGFEDCYPFQLSGGMRQRAALLRTVVQDCSVLLLDEPLGALDSLTRADMQVWIEQMWAEFAWSGLLVTHDVREAVYLADTVYVLSPRPGRVTARLDVDLARPRRGAVRGSPRFAELEALVLGALDGAASLGDRAAGPAPSR